MDMYMDELPHFTARNGYYPDEPDPLDPEHCANPDDLYEAARDRLDD